MSGMAEVGALSLAEPPYWMRMPATASPHSSRMS